MWLRFFKILFLVLFLHGIASGQEVVFLTQVGATKMGLEDAVQVRYEIKNVQGVESFSLQNMGEVEVVGGPSQGQNFSMIDGEVSMSVSITYAFKPKKMGVISLPVGVASVKGKKIKSNQVNIEVVRGSLAVRQGNNRRDPFDSDPLEELMQQQRQMSEWLRNQARNAQPQSRRAQPAPQQNNSNSPAETRTKPTKSNIGKNIFIRVDVDKTAAKVGEQITASYKLYTRIPMQINLTKLPDLNNFWTQDFDLPAQPIPKREILDGIEYQVFTIKKSALFPTQAGELILDPAEGEGTARFVKEVKVKNRNPIAEMFEDDPFFTQGFGSLLMDDPFFNEGFFNTYQYEDVPVKLRSKPVAILVSEDSPTDRPASFNGAVGQFKMESTINATEMTTDDVANLTLTTRGSGNLKLISPPKLTLASTIDLFDPIESDSITSKRNNRISGYKTIQYRFTPQSAGILKIPSMEFTYYDPEKNAYETMNTPEYTITVKPGKNPGLAGQKMLPKDIHDITDEKTGLFEERHFLLPQKIWYWSLYALPSLGFLFLIGYQRKQDEERSNSVAFKNKRANKIALKRLGTAEKHLKAGEQMRFFEEISKAVWLYMSDKLNIPLSSLSKEMAATLLQQKGVDQNLIDEAFLITDECELALYTPDSGNLKMNQIYSDSLNLIGKLEENLS